jgi:hypothetical protein
MNNEIMLAFFQVIVTLSRPVGAIICVTGNYLSASGCVKLPDYAQVGIHEIHWACISGYTINAAKTGCSPCGFNTYRYNSDDDGYAHDVGCYPVTSLAETEALMCAPGQYYAITAAPPLTVSCKPCSAPREILHTRCSNRTHCCTGAARHVFH